ncbi:MAG: hypothetical protein HYX42_19090 [Polaromonas sp.]|uniref:hypothetical protein n=1 Tax=Polaromonas sp. TaxID=1869339 RepID=UPI0025D781BF|nr:hypothetical protein [Polaromonas sp.]MBI2728350.1 hypothetical protein [Polaromonas sp.]
MSVSSVATDALLVQANTPDTSSLPILIQRLEKALPGTSVRIHAAFSRVQKQFYAYLYLDKRRTCTVDEAASLQSSLQKEFPRLQNLRVSRLEQVFATDGSSQGSAPAFHYAVEMDPESGWMPELSQWYDTEHMPGLAKVPGCIRASRFLNHDHGPLSLACYDLVTEETLGSEPWLAVRGTPWSDRMRPKFTNTIRTMFRSWPLP